MKKIISLVVALFCAVSLHAKGDLHIFDIENKSASITPQTVEEAFAENGFTIGINSEMNLPFTKQFKQTDYKIFTLLTLHHTKYATELVNKYPQASVFMPMGVGIYQNLKEDTLHLSILSADAQKKILGFDDKLLDEIEKDLLSAVKKAFPKAKHSYSEDSLKENRNLITQYELELESDTNIEDAQEEFQMGLESGFEPYGFVMPSYLDVNELLGKNSNYDFFVTYSICKLEVIYTVSKSRPEAAAFAPCTTMVYKKKDENKIVVGFPAVYNWLSSALVKDDKAVTTLQKAQNDFESILKSITE